MTRFLLIISAICLIQVQLEAQNRTVKGVVITEDMEHIPGVDIYTMDSVRIGKTEFNGRFVIEIPIHTKNLMFSFIGMEWLTIEFTEDCRNLEVIMMTHAIYDFITARKEDRLRKKRFNKLPEIRKQAFLGGLFESEQPCYKQEFVPFYQ